MSELYRAGRYGDARDVGTECRHLVIECFGADHPASASAANNLALMHKSLGETQDAVLLYSEALKTYRVVLGEVHSSTATAACNLALLYRDSGSTEKQVEATELLEGALATRLELLGESHPDVAAVMQQLASVVARQPDGMDRASKLLEQSLDKLEQTPGGQVSVLLSRQVLDLSRSTRPLAKSACCVQERCRQQATLLQRRHLRPGRIVIDI